MTTSPSLIQVFFFIEPGILPIRTTPSIQRSLRRFAPRRLSTVARTSLFSLRGVRTLATVSSGLGLVFDVGFFKSASLIPRYMQFAIVIVLFIFIPLNIIYLFFRALRLFVMRLSTSCCYFNAALFCFLLMPSSSYFCLSNSCGDRYIYRICLCMSHTSNKRASLLNY